jgi:hypothetical protein
MGYIEQALSETAKEEAELFKQRVQQVCIGIVMLSVWLTCVGWFWKAVIL